MSITLPLQPTADDIAHLESAHSARFTPHLLNPADPIRQRIIMERAVIRRAITDILAAGNWVRVFYGDSEYGCDKTDNLDIAMRAIGACDDEHLLVFRNSSDRTWSSVWFVYGNAGYEVIADNGERVEPLLAGANAFADELADATCGV